MPPIYLLPGWQDSGPGHWQARWAELHGDHKVEQADWIWPRRGDWMARLDEALLADDRLADTPAVLAAHGLGCHLVVAWAAHSRLTARVGGALLVAPPDTERPNVPPQLHGWTPMPTATLPFPAVTVLSRDDPFGDYFRMAAVAEGWGSRLVDAGPRGHLNGESGLGDWPAGRQLLLGLGRA